MIETERLVLRTATREEMEGIIASQSDAALREAYREMLQGCLDHPSQWTWYAVWLAARKDGTPVGDLSFKGLQPDGSVEIGYGTAEEHRGRGYASEAVDALARWALAQPGVLRVEAEAEAGNTASRRVLEKCGFVPTGTVGEEGPRFVRTSA